MISIIKIQGTRNKTQTNSKLFLVIVSWDLEFAFAGGGRYDGDRICEFAVFLAHSRPASAGL
ncbi:MAG: hypothetical protein A3A97_01585 [Candidatus Terrybacteria bacterium RIFCSPLOWO2_01_FULL_40_23]|uniref:Uncharacterized protein n=1 Tax=Candidatus Terrybacteria bacterium RIFCSPLOWO2_01_FULL_40_23 TaxID=1802366 RepID=A0A1G2PQZ9_9BACT|nr:MAG: hypothetical protein A3A97_01585 [Candidatus Terrybacteria bacterium RIFCSPLOWO2_01_FULL_40_23]